MKTTDQLFADDAHDEWHARHDVLMEVDGQERTKEEVRALFEALPERIRDEAHAWSLNDSVFRDMAYTHWIVKPKG